LVTFEEFVGNSHTVEGLRAAIAAGRLPRSMILLGPRGAGKYTLAIMLTMALECQLQPRELSSEGRELASFCGTCRNCTRIAEAADLDARIEEAVTVREDMRETDKKDTRVLVQTHPDVLVIPPDPPQLLIKLGQIRTMIQRAQYLPTEAPAKVFILTSAAFMKEVAENLGELLPTIRSRCGVSHLGALPMEEISSMLAKRRPEMNRSERDLTARLSEGAFGRALGFNLSEYAAARADALTILQGAERGGDHSALFKMTESYRAGAEGQVKTTSLLRAFSSVLEDMLLLQSGAGDRIRNIDKRADLQRMADTFSFDWIESAVRAMDAVQSGLRRNLLRSLSLDALAVELEGAGR